MTRNILTDGSNPNDLSTYTTANFTPGPNHLVLAFVSSTSQFGQAGTPTALGAGLSWQVVQSIPFGQSAGRRLTCFSAIGPAPSTGLVAFDFGGQVQDGCAWSVFEYDGVDPANSISQPHSQTATAATSLSIGMGALAGSSNVVVGAVALELSFDPVRPIAPGPGFVEIHEQTAANAFGNSTNLQTQDRTGGSGNVAWAWDGAKNAAGIVLEVVAASAAPVVPSATDEQLVRRFEPVLFLHRGEAWRPSNAKTYLEHAALWTTGPPPDKRASWGGSAGASFPRKPTVAPGKIKAEDDATPQFIGFPANQVEDPTEHFLELGGWIDKSAAAQPDVTAASANQYGNRKALADMYRDVSALRESQLCYHAEVFRANRLVPLAKTVTAPALTTLVDSLNDPILICYYLFFPAHEQKLAAACTNIEAAEIACYIGEWSCVAILLERVAASHEPKYLGFTGSQTPQFTVDGEELRSPQYFDDERRTNLKVVRWRPPGVNPVLPAVDGDHPRLYVSLGTHSMYLEPGDHPVDPFAPGPEPTNCGRSDEFSYSPNGPPPRDLDWVFWLKIAYSIWTSPASLELIALENYLPRGQILGLPFASDAVPPDEGPIGSDTALTIRPAGVAVAGVGGDVHDWELGIPVDRPHQLWWPSDDGRTGYRGRWGQRVEDDPVPRRCGIRFPEFWKMFLHAVEAGRSNPKAWGI